MQAALDAGATLVGKTHMDECAFSLHGINVHYGTPRNPACPDRIPGGSSSGSVVSPLVTCCMHVVQATALLRLQTYMRAGLLGSHVVTCPPVPCGAKVGHQLGLLMGGCRGGLGALQGVPVAVWGSLQEGSLAGRQMILSPGAWALCCS